MVTREMAEAVIRNGRGDFDILAFIPERLWDAQLAYLALRSYIYDPYYTDSRTDAVMKTGLILGYVPVEVKTQEFYYGMLDGMKILSTVTDAVVPSRFKTAAYYRKMAEHDLSLVPARFYSYEILHAAVCSTEGKNFITDPSFQAVVGISGRHAGGPADGETPLHVRGVAEAVQDTGKTGHCHR